MGVAIGWPEVVAALLSLVGLVGTVAPLLPGPWLIFLTALGYAWLKGFPDAMTGMLWIVGALALLAQGVDVLSGAVAARAAGASKRAFAGAALGAILGVAVMGPLGIVIGPFAGAFAAELLSGRSARESGRAGVWAGVGTLAGLLVKALLGLVMVGVFWTSLWRSLALVR